MTAPLADDFAYIRSRLAELEGEPKEAEQPKAWPDYAGADSAAANPDYAGTQNAAADYGQAVWGHYSAPDMDCA